jgi:hypothetical protein
MTRRRLSARRGETDGKHDQGNTGHGVTREDFLKNYLGSELDPL